MCMCACVCQCLWNQNQIWSWSDRWQWAAHMDAENQTPAPELSICWLRAVKSIKGRQEWFSHLRALCPRFVLVLLWLPAYTAFLSSLWRTLLCWHQLPLFIYVTLHLCSHFPLLGHGGSQNAVCISCEPDCLYLWMALLPVCLCPWWVGGKYPTTSSMSRQQQHLCWGHLGR